MCDSISSSRNGRSLAGKGFKSVEDPFLRANCDTQYTTAVYAIVARLLKQQP